MTNISNTGSDMDLNFLSWKDFLAGWASGICSISVGYPLETIKVRQQTMPNFGSASHHAIFMLKTEGAQSFFRGLSYPLWTTGILNSLYFGFYGNSLRMIEEMKGEKNFRNCCEDGAVYKGWHLDCFWAGCVGGSVSTIVNTPIELAKTVLQAHAVKRRQKTLRDLQGSIKTRDGDDVVLTPTKYLIRSFKSRGLRHGCFHGGCVLFIRDVPTFGLYAVIYEHIACILKQSNSSVRLPNVICEGIAGGCSGVITWFLALPIDVVKTRYMYDAAAAGLTTTTADADVKVNRKYTGILDCVRKTHKLYGIPGFYTGIWEKWQPKPIVVAHVIKWLDRKFPNPYRMKNGLYYMLLYLFNLHNYIFIKIV